MKVLIIDPIDQSSSATDTFEKRDAIITRIQERSVDEVEDIGRHILISVLNGTSSGHDMFAIGATVLTFDISDLVYFTKECKNDQDAIVLEAIAESHDINRFIEAEPDPSHLPLIAGGYSVISYRDQIYIFGGHDERAHEFYTLSRGITKKDIAPLSPHFHKGAMVIHRGVVHMLGGGVLKTYFQHYTYNGNSWKNMMPSSFMRRFQIYAAVIHLGEIHIFGRTSVNEDILTEEYLLNHYVWDYKDWEFVSNLPYNMYTGSVVEYNEEIHILGGLYGMREHCKWTGKYWVPVSTLPYDFHSGAAVVYNGAIHILGGGSFGDHETCRKHYKWDGDTWIEVSTLPCELIDADAIVYHNAIHIFGDNTRDYWSWYKWYDEIGAWGTGDSYIHGIEDTKN